MAYRNILLTFHIAAAAAWLGANFVQLALTPWFVRRGGDATVAWFEATAALAKRYYSAAGGLLAISGVLLVLELGYGWGSGFIAVGVTVIVIGAVMGVVFFGPHGEQLAEAARGGGPVEATRYLQVALFDTVLVLLAIWAMASGWGAEF